MAKLTMEEYAKGVAMLSKWPRRNRDMVVRMLEEQAYTEDAKRVGKVTQAEPKWEVGE
jgi:hypothetical protein